MRFGGEQWHIYAMNGQIQRTNQSQNQSKPPMISNFQAIIYIHKQQYNIKKKSNRTHNKIICSDLT